MDEKGGKAAAYEVVMPNNDKNGYFSCENPKGSVAAN